MRYCNKCGKEFFGSPQNCPECVSILDEQKNETAPNANPSPYPYSYPQNSGGYPNQPPVQQAKSSKTWIIVVVAIVAAIAVVVTGAIFVFNYIEKENGKKELELLLLRDWSRIEESNGVYYTLELDFSRSSIKYNFVDEIGMPKSDSKSDCISYINEFNEYIELNTDFQNLYVAWFTDVHLAWTNNS